jgi:hypothetical protein
MCKTSWVLNTDFFLKVAYIIIVVSIMTSLMDSDSKWIRLEMWNTKILDVVETEN